MACGLGGGSLVNAGVIAPTPVRARRNPKWPKEWQKDWEIYEASASAMLRAQSVPAKFPSANIMSEVIGDEFEESLLKLSINFQAQKQPSPKIDTCLACGNCLSGCPYNAKYSTDKNYIFTAIQEGCAIKTDCHVQYVIKNSDNIFKQENMSTKRRRFNVFFNEIDYVGCDFVVLSAGVFGTAKILFQSKMRGLELSDMLGSGLSCNGNNVAYLARSAAPLSSSGLHRKHLLTIPLQERPGPAISSSYTNSLGFTIQSAVLPASYSDILFEGVTTYSWPPGYGILYGIIYKLKFILGMKKSEGVGLNVMGYDESDGKITLDKHTDEISFQPPHDTLLPHKVKAFQKLSKKLGGILYMSKYRSTSVHLLGGCNASEDHSHGVCNDNGQVFDTKFDDSVHAGLYVCDASLIPCSVGINPCLTIAAASEHVCKHLVPDVLKYKNKNGEGIKDTVLSQTMDSVGSETTDGSRIEAIIFTETMRGHIGGMLVTAYLKLKMNSKTSKDCDRPSMNSKVQPLLRGRVGGYVICTAIEMDKLHVIDGEVDMCEVNIRSPYTQIMHYRVLLAASSGSRYILEGKKILNPFLLGFYALRESTELHVTLKRVNINSTKDQDLLNLKGSLHISMIELLKTLISMKGNRKLKFITLLLQSFFKTYILQVPRGIYKGFNTSEAYGRTYPSSILLKIKTDDNFVISCKQWKCSQYPQGAEEEKKLHPVLLINGYATESYWLPTEPNDMVRTLLGQGYETWLLEPRFHHSNSSNSFSIEDIGRYDIPAVLRKISELNNANSEKVHVVAHCAGGLAIHIAIMGGHVLSSQIASLSCTNSSMFFKLTALACFKMWLPLLPITMLILGKIKTLPMLETLKINSSQRLVRSIARIIPRYERCNYDECEVFSGIFGNTFWHTNITLSMHNWLNKKSLPVLPVAGLRHLRKICNHGFIVDNNGNNTYLIHPERMALSTLYISGGKTILVTPQTSFLANKYMKLHQPNYRHERVVVDGFGHSDLLIGQDSYKKVFPHILSHIEFAEKDVITSSASHIKNRKYYSKQAALAWAHDPYEKNIQGYVNCTCPIISIILFLLLLLIFLGDVQST